VGRAGQAKFLHEEACDRRPCGPWSCRTQARRVLPVHDGYVKDFFRQSRHQMFRGYLERKQIGFEAVDANGAAEL